MTRGTTLQRSDIQKHARRGIVTLAYTGRVKKRVARLHGQDENTFFVVNAAAIPLPDDIEELAQQAGVTLIDSPTEASFRQLVGEALVAEALENAPEHLLAVTGVDFEWPDSTLVTLERDTKEAELRLDALIREVTARLRSKTVERMPVYDWVPVSASTERREQAQGAPRRAVARPVDDEEDEPEPAPSPAPAPLPPSTGIAASEAVLMKIRDATRAARDRDVPQRLPAGSRKAVEASPPGALVWANSKVSVCRSIEDAIGGARAVAVKGMDAAVIDWDGEQPVLVRRFTAGGITSYRCEDSVKVVKADAPEEPAPATLPAEEPQS